MFKKKQKEIVEEKYTPIFPIYLDTMRIKDTLAIVNNGITNIYTVTKDTTNESENGIGIKGSGDLYKVSLEGNFNKNQAITNRHSEQFERVHTDTSLFYKVLEEFKRNNRIKNIKNKEDINNAIEGEIVLLEGNIYGNEMIDLYNKIVAAVETFVVFDTSGKLKEASEQIKSLEMLLSTSNKITNTINMVCKLSDGNELLLLLDTKYLIGDTGIELAHGKFKVLGVVYEKISEEETINLARDSMIGLFKEKEKDIDENKLDNKPYFYNIDPFSNYDYENTMQFILSEDASYKDKNYSEQLAIIKNTDNAILVIDHISINDINYYPAMGEVIDKNQMVYLEIFSNNEIEVNDIKLYVKDIIGNTYTYMLVYNAQDEKIVQLKEI